MCKYRQTGDDVGVQTGDDAGVQTGNDAGVQTGDDAGDRSEAIGWAAGFIVEVRHFN